MGFQNKIFENRKLQRILANARSGTFLFKGLYKDLPGCYQIPSTNFPITQLHMEPVQEILATNEPTENAE